MSRFLLPIPPDHRVRRFVQLVAGLVLYGATAAMIVLAQLGLDPWDVLHQGLARTFGLAIGTWAIIVSVAVLLLWIPLGQRPGVGTIVRVRVMASASASPTGDIRCGSCAPALRPPFW